MASLYTRNERKAGPSKALSETDLRSRRVSVNIATQTTTDILSGRGWLHKIIVNGGTMGAVTVYDEATGASTTKIATIGSTGLVPGATFPYDCPLTKGLQIVTAAATDVTAIISY